MAAGSPSDELPVSAPGVLAGFYEDTAPVASGRVGRVTFDALTVAESRRNRARRRGHMTPTGARRTGRRCVAGSTSRRGECNNCHPVNGHVAGRGVARSARESFPYLVKSGGGGDGTLARLENRWGLFRAEDVKMALGRGLPSERHQNPACVNLEAAKRSEKPNEPVGGGRSL